MEGKKLMPCPFCGGNASYVYDPFAVEDTMGRKWAYSVSCNWCAASTGLCYSRERSIEAWNRRVDAEDPY